MAERNGQEVPDDIPLVLQSRGLEIPDVFQINDAGCKELELPNGKVECFKDKKQVFGEEKFAKAGFQIDDSYLRSNGKLGRHKASTILKTKLGS